jgi:hypothetical protein
MSNRTPIALWYLNDHGDAKPRFRIESKRSGQRTIWKDRVRMGGMKEAKAYIESVWGR